MPANPAAEIRIEALTPSRAGDYLAFFDHRGGPAFADNPQWSTCYCQYHHTPIAVDWDARSGEDNRAAMEQRIATGEMEGFLAYAPAKATDNAGDTAGTEGTAGTARADAGQVVGWVNVQPRNKLAHCFARMDIAPTPLEHPDFRIAQIMCFIVHPAWRRRGVARALLEGACDALARRGIRAIEAYPRKAADRDAPTAHYHGPRQLFLDAGFAIVRDDPRFTVVQKTLSPP